MSSKKHVIRFSESHVCLLYICCKSRKYKTTHIKYANMKNSLSFVCLKNINNYKIEY